MVKYRFKTEAEFRADNEWRSWDGFPRNWAHQMLKYLGADVPECHNDDCDNGKYLTIQDREGHTTWTIQPSEYVLKETTTIGGFELHEVKEIQI